MQALNEWNLKTKVLGKTPELMIDQQTVTEGKLQTPKEIVSS